MGNETYHPRAANASTRPSPGVPGEGETHGCKTRPLLNQLDAARGPPRHGGADDDRNLAIGERGIGVIGDALGVDGVNRRRLDGFAIDLQVAKRDGEVRDIANRPPAAVDLDEAGDLRLEHQLIPLEAERPTKMFSSFSWL